jgi:hypothetical protein
MNDPNGNHMIEALDGVVRDKANVQKCVNHTLRAMEGLKLIPERVQGQPWYALSLPPDRHWNAAQGPMPISIRAENAANEVDTTVNRDVLLVGHGLGDTSSWGMYERVKVVRGQAETQLTLEGAGEAQLYVLDPETHATGAAPSFTWS